MTTKETLAYSPEEAADALGVSRSLIYKLMAEGELKRVNVAPNLESKKYRVVIPKESLMQLLERRSVASKEQLT